MVQQPDPGRHGAARWSSPEWRQEAVTWLDEQLAATGIARSGEVEQRHLRPWATVLRAPTNMGVVWLKAAAPGTAFEVGLYEVLARRARQRVLVPLAADVERGWVLLPDGGATLGDRLTGTELAEALSAAIVRYGELQRALAPHLDELLAVGVADMRPAVMPDRFEEALDVTAPTADPAIHRRVAALRPVVARWCEQLAASPMAASLDHNDLHGWNILGAGATTRFYDWGDSVVAHPFAAMLVPLGQVRHHLGASLDDPRFRRARDAYLEVFADDGPGENLTSTLETACRVAKLARVLTWHRSVQAACEQGEAIDDAFATAPAETLASLLDDSYLGGS